MATRECFIWLAPGRKRAFIAERYPSSTIADDTDVIPGCASQRQCHSPGLRRAIADDDLRGVWIDGDRVGSDNVEDNRFPQ